jgi:lysophospholipase L1-like esterase
MRPLLGRLGLAAASVLLLAGVLELGLRLAGYRFSPVVLVAGKGRDFRAFHLEADPLVVFDAEVFWRPNPAAWADMDTQGFRSLRSARPGELLVVAVGDSNTIGTPAPGAHWTADLQLLLERNTPARPVRVVNAGCVGWSSFQGLRRFRQVLRLRPAVVLFSFGANDAHLVGTTDAEYAGRVAWLRRMDWSRLAPVVAHRLWALLDGRRPELRPRVGLDEHRGHLRDVLQAARAHGVTALLLTRPYLGGSSDPKVWLAAAPAYRRVACEVAADAGSACVDAYQAFAGSPRLFEGESHYNRKGRHKMSVLLLRRLKAMGHVQTAHAYEAALEPGRVEDTRPELGPGWWHAEPWAERGWGRWTAGEATLILERRGSEDRLDVDLTLSSPGNRTTGRIEVNGRALAVVAGPNGPWRRSVDVGGVPGSELLVRFVTDHPYVPQRLSPGERDARTLGVFVHSARLSSSSP